MVAFLLLDIVNCSKFSNDVFRLIDTIWPIFPVKIVTIMKIHFVKRYIMGGREREADMPSTLFFENCSCLNHQQEILVKSQNYVSSNAKYKLLVVL